MRPVPTLTHPSPSRQPNMGNEQGRPLRERIRGWKHKLRVDEDAAAYRGSIAGLDRRASARGAVVANGSATGAGSTAGADGAGRASHARRRLSEGDAPQGELNFAPPGREDHAGQTDPGQAAQAPAPSNREASSSARHTAHAHGASQQTQQAVDARGRASGSGPSHSSRSGGHSHHSGHSGASRRRSSCPAAPTDLVPRLIPGMAGELETVEVKPEVCTLKNRPSDPEYMVKAAVPAHVIRNALHQRLLDQQAAGTAGAGTSGADPQGQAGAEGAPQAGAGDIAAANRPSRSQANLQNTLPGISELRIRKGHIENDWVFHKKKTLGTGFSGAVMLATHKRTRVSAAVKTFAKRKMKNDRRMEMLRDELNVYVASHVDTPLTTVQSLLKILNLETSLTDPQLPPTRPPEHLQASVRVRRYELRVAGDGALHRRALRQALREWDVSSRP